MGRRARQNGGVPDITAGLSEAERADRLDKLQGLMDLMRPAVQADGGDLVLVRADVEAGVVDGRVELRIPGGRVVSLGPDDTFGEMGIVDGSPRAATAVAAEDSTLAVIDRKVFLFLVGETPTFALQVMSSLAELVRARD